LKLTPNEAFQVWNVLEKMKPIKTISSGAYWRMQYEDSVSSSTSNAQREHMADYYDNEVRADGCGKTYEVLDIERIALITKAKDALRVRFRA